MFYAYGSWFGAAVFHESRDRSDRDGDRNPPHSLQRSVTQERAAGCDDKITR